jgi:hypothetical protein
MYIKVIAMLSLGVGLAALVNGDVVLATVTLVCFVGWLFLLTRYPK